MFSRPVTKSSSPHTGGPRQMPKPWQRLNFNELDCDCDCESEKRNPSENVSHEGEQSDNLDENPTLKDSNSPKCPTVPTVAKEFASHTSNNSSSHDVISQAAASEALHEKSLNIPITPATQKLISSNLTLTPVSTAQCGLSIPVYSTSNITLGPMSTVRHSSTVPSQIKIAAAPTSIISFSANKNIFDLGLLTPDSALASYAVTSNVDAKNYSNFEVLTPASTVAQGLSMPNICKSVKMLPNSALGSAFVTPGTTIPFSIITPASASGWKPSAHNVASENVTLTPARETTVSTPLSSPKCNESTTNTSRPAGTKRRTSCKSSSISKKQKSRSCLIKELEIIDQHKYFDDYRVRIGGKKKNGPDAER